MAVTFDAVGPSGTAATGGSPLTWAHTCGASATHLIVGATCDVNPDTGFTMTATYNGVTMTSLGVWHTGLQTVGFLQLWSLANPATGVSHNVVVTASSSPNSIDGGSISFNGSGSLSAVQATVPSGNTTNPSANFTGAISGNMVVGFCGGGSALTQTGSFTGRFIGGVGGQGAGFVAGATIASSGTVTNSYTMATDVAASALVEVQAAPPLPPAIYLTQPGRTWLRWFRKPQYFNQQPPGPVMTQANPVTASAMAAALNASVITVSAAAAPTFNPGKTWRKHFQWPQQQQLSGPPPICWAPAGTATATATANDAYQAHYITGVSSDGTYFVGATGTPQLLVGEDTWALPVRAGEWNGGNWQLDLDTYFSQRAAQGYNATEVSLVSTGDTAESWPFTDGRDWDGVWPFTNSMDPTTAANETFWTRRDYMFNSAARNGITIVCSFPGVGPQSPCAAWTGTQWTAYGTFLGNRYKNQPNILWIAGDGNFGSYNTGLSTFLTALRATGDTHALSYQGGDETSSRRGFGSDNAGPDPEPFMVNAQYDWVYTYNVSYPGVISAITQEPSPSDVVQGRIPVVWGDGTYLASGHTAPQTDVHLEQNFIWWALSSGACGFSTGDNDIFAWGNGALGFVTSKSFYTTVMPAIVSYFTSLPGWWKLRPDVNSLLVTSGRNSQTPPMSTTGPPYTTNDDNYVTAAYAADGTLAVIYCGQHFSITIDQSRLGKGYTANWVDPATGATTVATPGSSFDSTPLGNSSAGLADWVLVLQGPPITGGVPSGYALPGRTWRRRFQHQQQPVPPAPVVAATNAPAGLAAASVIALGQDTGANIASVLPNAGNAAATGTSLGQDTGADIAMLSPNAAVAPATGTARGQDTGDPLPGVSYPTLPATLSKAWRHYFQHPQQPAPPAPFNVYPATATATGSALGQDNDATMDVQVSPNAGTAAATGTSLGNDTGANEPAVTVNAGVASAVASALDASASLPAAAAQPAYPGGVWRHYFQHPQQFVPPAPGPSTLANAGVATASVIALGQDTGADIAMVSPNAGNAAATATAQAPNPSVTPNAGNAAVTATGQNATANIQPNAGNAGATVAAQGQDNGSNLAAVTVNANTAAGIATAGNVSTQAPATPLAPAYPGGVWRHYFQHPQQIPAVAPSPVVNAQAGLASATGTALGQDTGANIASVSPNAGNAAATGTSLGQDTGANPASVTVNAAVAPATGAAQAPNPSVAVNAGLGSATGTAQQPGLLIVIPPPQQPAYPSPVWRRYFQHPQQWRPFVPPPPPFFQPATSTSTVTDPREGILAAAADGREGSASVRDLSEGSAVHN